ncbi:MAG: hydrogenase maturation protease [Burkholderiaceae bacterium]|nr:hydrogenase maturation protease [Burkholderiaceae bacterium]
MKQAASVLIFGWGNPSRGDDALGPVFIERLQDLLTPAMLGRVELLTDFQLQVEHALDLIGRDQVLFVDASTSCAHPFEVSSLLPLRDQSFTTHALSPASLLQVYRDVQGIEPPSCTQLAIYGERFELGEPLSDAALSNLEQALSWTLNWLASDVAMVYA